MTFSCPECRSQEGFEELLRLVESSPIKFKMVDGQIEGISVSDESRIESGVLIGYRCTSCRAEFTQPVVAV